mmetsp:Transcript_29841/g.81906  ORF Transcript_29841/g.81906 Transcript_29841/m.81906 type:complete len:224 (-) Transcript_29841:5-676(-)
MDLIWLRFVWRSGKSSSRAPRSCSIASATQRRGGGCSTQSSWRPSPHIAPRMARARMPQWPSCAPWPTMLAQSGDRRRSCLGPLGGCSSQLPRRRASSTRGSSPSPRRIWRAMCRPCGAATQRKSAVRTPLSVSSTMVCSASLRASCHPWASGMRRWRHCMPRSRAWTSRRRSSIGLPRSTTAVAAEWAVASGPFDNGEGRRIARAGACVWSVALELRHKGGC